MPLSNREPNPIHDDEQWEIILVDAATLGGRPALASVSAMMPNAYRARLTVPTICNEEGESQVASGT
jgi:hypothetical protein